MTLEKETAKNQRQKDREERRRRAYNLREEGLQFKEIGEIMGFTAQRAREIYKSEEWRRKKTPQWYDGLSVRAYNALSYCAGINSRAEAMEAVESRKLSFPNRYRNYGRKTHIEILEWLGLAQPCNLDRKAHSPKTCPHCGGKI